MHPRLVARALPVVALIALVAVAPSTPAHAKPRGWTLPENAKEVAPDVYEVGSKQEGANTLTCWAVIHRGSYARPSGSGGGSKSGSSGYTYLSSGMKWKTVENYVVDPSVTHWDGTANAAYIRGVVSGAITQWEDAANGTINGNVVNIMGGEASGTVDVASIGVSMNDVNEVCFAPIAESGVIAVTYVWGYYYGPTKTREIVEWDQMYDDDGDWLWGDVGTSGNLAAMDFANIAQHEIGHAFGMGHSPATYTEETMYAYASEGETKKRDLGPGDIAGINNLY